MDYGSIAAILSFLVVSRGLEISGIFGRMAKEISHFSNSEFGILSVLIILTSLSSAVIMNDTAIFVFVPLVLALSKTTEINLPKAVTSVALAANVGSALTPVGNPQNIIIWRTYGLPIWQFVFSMLPYVLLWLVILLVFVWVGSRRMLEVHPMPKIKINLTLAATSALLLVINIVLVEWGFASVGLLLTLLVMAVVGRESLFALDPSLIAVFILIFIDFRELSFLLPKVGCYAAFKLVLLSAGLSQLISNVPATVLLASQNLPWHPIAVGVNLGGCGVVIGSLANFIAVRISRISLREFHRYSLPYFLSTLLLTLVVFKTV